MREWKEKRLSEVGTLQRGKSRHRPRYAFHLYGGKYPFVQTGEIKAAAKYITSFEQTYSEAGLAQSKLWNTGTLCITIAANIADVAILSFPACFPDSVIGFIPDEKESDLQFVFYTLKHFQRELQAFGDGSVQDNINLGTFEQIKFPFPDVPEQKAIAEVLSSLDDKIDLLHRQNKTLESLAQTLFRQWFIEEADDTWETRTVGDVASINESSLDKDYEHKEIEYLDTGSITDNIVSEYQYLSLKEAPSRAKRIVKNNDIIISTVRPIHRHYGLLKSVKSNTIVSTGFCVITCTEIDPHFMYIFLTQKEMTEYFDVIAEGSTSAYPSLKPSDISSVEFKMPPRDLLAKFSGFASNAWQKLEVNKEQIRLLTSLRDQLLPKLMSGEVTAEI